MRHEQRGFSLIELLIVVAINSHYRRYRHPQLPPQPDRREPSLCHREYANHYHRRGNLFHDLWIWVHHDPDSAGPSCLWSGVTSTAAGLLDDVLAAGYKSGYSFFYTPSEYSTGTNQYYGYTLLGNPSTFGQTGGVYYYSDQSGVIRANSVSTAGSTDSAVAD